MERVFLAFVELARHRELHHLLGVAIRCGSSQRNLSFQTCCRFFLTLNSIIPLCTNHQRAMGAVTLIFFWPIFFRGAVGRVETDSCVASTALFQIGYPARCVIGNINGRDRTFPRRSWFKIRAFFSHFLLVSTRWWWWSSSARELSYNINTLSHQFLPFLDKNKVRKYKVEKERARSRDSVRLRKKKKIHKEQGKL